MADGQDQTGPQAGAQMDGLGAVPPGWHPDGIMAGVPALNAAAAQSTLGAVMTPEQIADVDWGADGAPQLGPAYGSGEPAPLPYRGTDIPEMEPLDSEQPLSPDQQVAAGSEAAAASGTAPQHPIGPVKGYPETGKDSWRTANDDAIRAAADKYNRGNGYSPGDPEYMTPQVMKSWMMQESGGDRAAFQTDPFQVNNRGDWVPEKAPIAGLSEGQAMTPQTSADAALKWLQYKGTVHAADGSAVSYRGPLQALMNYNGGPNKVGYANSILNRAHASYGDGQR